MMRTLGLLVAMMALGACAPGSSESTSATPAAPEPPVIGMPNPASVHCGREGGRTEIRRSTSGEYGVCIFPDGRQCEEWALFRDGRCTLPQAGA